MCRQSSGTRRFRFSGCRHFLWCDTPADQFFDDDVFDVVVKKGRDVANRILEFSQCPVKLRVRRHQLVIDRSGQPLISEPLSDVAVIVAAHPEVTYSQAVLAEIVAQGGIFVVCDKNRLPAGMLLPLDWHSTQTTFFHRQIALAVPRRKQLWKQVVQSKIAMQAMLLVEQTGCDHELTPLISKVRSGDPGNVEAWAARRYWSALFGDEFRRDRGTEHVNALLNYGYAILRAAAARAICAAGLHPSIGLHHHNKYNPWGLADDLMEPYRPIVDRVVWKISDGGKQLLNLDPGVKQRVISAILSHAKIGDETQALFDALSTSAVSFREAMQTKTSQLVFPEEFCDDTERIGVVGV